MSCWEDGTGKLSNLGGIGYLVVVKHLLFGKPLRESAAVKLGKYKGFVNQILFSNRFMFPIRVISFNNGWNVLSQENPRELQDIKDALLEMTPEILTKPSEYINYKPNNPVRSDEIAFTYLSEVWNYLISKREWVDIQYPLNTDSLNKYHIENVKNKVSSKLIGGFGKEYDVDKFLLSTVQRAFKAGVCNVFVAVSPMQSIADIYSALGDNDFLSSVFDEKHTFAIIDSALPLNTKAPIIFIFFARQEQKLVIDEMPAIDVAGVVERSIEFEPEYYQAGVGILSYFGKVLRQKHPDINAKVRIEQDGNTVRMRVESPTGEYIDMLEEELTRYALVIKGAALPEDILDNPIDVLALKNKFEMAQLEVRQTRELLQYTRAASEKRITSLEEDVAFLRQTMGAQLMHSNTLVGAMLQQSSGYEKLQAMQIGHAQGLFNDLLGEAHGNQITLNAIKSLEHNLMSGLATMDVQEQIKESLATIQQSSPGLVARVAAQIESAGYGVLAGPALEWLQHLRQ